MRIDAKAKSSERGQALVMVTLALFAIFGMIALAVDLGWSYFRAKAARAAADTGALAAAKTAFTNIGTGGSYTCATVECEYPTPADCTTLNGTTYLKVGCQYAGANDFNYSGNAASSPYATNANTAVKIQANIGAYTTATGGTVASQYWVKAIAAESIPQLFSGFLGHATGQASAFGTAAIVKVLVNGSLILLNRQNDRTHFNNGDQYGENLKVQANNNQGAFALQTNGNILLSSSCNGTSTGSTNCMDGNSATYAGVNQGGGTVCTGTGSNGSCTPTAGTFVSGGGGVNCGNGAGNSVCTTSSWDALPKSGADPVDDPMAGRGQPTPPSGLTNIPVTGGVINSSAINPVTGQALCPSGVCTPGNYYAVNSSGAATGAALTIQGNVRFASCSGCTAGTSFGQYVFFGGIAGGGSSTTVQFDPGEYILAGVQPANNNTPGQLINTNTNFNIQDATSSTGANSDAGEVFVLTDLNYRGGPNGSTALQVPPAVQAFQSSASASNQLQFGTVNLQAGNNGTQINLHGLNSDNSNVPSNLQGLGPALFWQDQRNSFVKYTNSGNVDTSSCANGSMDAPCTNSLPMPGSPELTFQASSSVHLFGVIYQPRGAWTSLANGGSGYSGPVQIISGAFNVQANAHLDLTAPTRPLTVLKVALIE